MTANMDRIFDEEPNDVFGESPTAQSTTGTNMVHQSPTLLDKMKTIIDDMGIIYLQNARIARMQMERLGFEFKAVDPFDMNYYDKQFEHWFKHKYPTFGSNFGLLTREEQVDLKHRCYRVTHLAELCGWEASAESQEA